MVDGRHAAGWIGLCLAGTAWAAAPERLVRVVDVEPAVASDDRLAFVSNRGGGGLELYIARPDGKELTQLTHSGGGKDTPAWSPDGQRIAFVSEAGDNADIHVIARDGTGLRRLTTSPENDLHPHWSPDGGSIIFTRYTRGGAPDDGRLDIFVMNADGSNERQLTRGSQASYASWSPDGKQLAYWRFFGANADIVVADAVGHAERRLTTDPAFEGWPSWSPDNRAIAFAREESDDSSNIFVITLADGATRQLTSGPGRKTAPKWSASGKQILFNRTVGGETGIWRIDSAR